MVTASRGHDVTLTASINAGMPLESITSRYHPVSVSQDRERYSVTLDSTDVPLDHDFGLVWQPAPSSAPRAMAFTETVDGQPYYLLMLMPPDAPDFAPSPMPREKRLDC